MHNAAAADLISPSGEILLRHRKIKELDIAPRLYAQGRSLAVAETAIGAIGLLTCPDAFPSSLSLGHALARMGADAVLSPCAWAVEAGARRYPPSSASSASPCVARRRGPMPGMSASSSRVAGRRRAISRRVRSWRMT